MVSAIELQSISVSRADETSSSNPVWIEVEPLRNGENARDEAILARLGKRQALKRNFDFVSMVAFTCLTLASWESFYELFFPVATINGGPGTVIYGFLIIFIGTVSTFISIGELASIAPTAGGQYHWVYMLGPVQSRKILSYLTGWMTLLSWQATTVSSAYTTGTVLDGLLILNYPQYQTRAWRVILYNWAMIIVALLANTLGSILLPVVHCAFLLMHVLGFIAVFIILCYVTPHGTVEEVFSSVNGGGWPTQGLSAIVGLTSMVFVFLGADAAVHLSEEINNAPVNVPRSILASILVNGLMGVAVMVPTVFGIVEVDTDNLLASEEDYPGYPFIPMFKDFTGNKEGSTVITSLILAMTVACLTCIVTTTSRMTWAFARDRALPFSDHLVQINKRILGPLNAILVTISISALLSLVTLGPIVAFESLVSLSVAGFYSTYLISVGLLLWRRIKGDIKEPHEMSNDNLMVTDIKTSYLAWGPWRVRGWLGTANNIFACAYLLIIMYFSFWPAQVNPDGVSFNYSIVVVVVVLLCSTCYYLLVARRRYNGPVVEIVL